MYVKAHLSNLISAYSDKVYVIHNRKYINLRICSPSFQPNNNAIFNHSSYELSIREKFLLSFGLDFCLPCFKPKFTEYFLSFEKLATLLKPLCNNDTFIKFRKDCSNLAYSTYTRPKQNTWYPFLKQIDINILKNLTQNKSVVITKPDKDKGVVLLDRNYYNSKIFDILSDNNKFHKLNDLKNFKLVFNIEDKINRCLLKFKNNKVISDEPFNSLHCTGSSFGLLYGLPKVHKPAPVPIRLILAAYNLPSYKLAKFLVPLLSPLTTNRYSVKKSFEFPQNVQSIDPNNFLVSYDVESLFTNVPLHETIDIILNLLFSSYQSYSSFTNSL